MRKLTILLSLLAASATTSCKDVECGDGTIERDGTCQPANTTTSGGMCGPFTELQGDRCAPQFPPTECDPATTTPTVDPETGVTTCIGTGGGGCSAPFPCPTPTEANRLTVCGQIYDFETDMKFQGMDPGGAPCDPSMPATSGPCALQIVAFDAIQFAMNPSGASPRPVESVYIDDCGRYRLENIDIQGTGPFIGLGFDDAGAPFGPTGVTVTVGVAVGKTTPVVSDFEGFILKASTVQSWTTSAGGGSGPNLGQGFYVASYRKHKLAPGVDRFAKQEGVTFSDSTGTTNPANDWYFTANQTTVTTVDPAANVTGLNGTALAQGVVLGSTLYGGVGGLTTAGCRWEPHAAANVPGVAFIQIFRKIDQIGQPGSCTE